MTEEKVFTFTPQTEQEKAEAYDLIIDIKNNPSDARYYWMDGGALRIILRADSGCVYDALSPHMTKIQQEA